MSTLPAAPKGAAVFTKKEKIPLDILGKGWYHTMRVVNTTP